MNTPLSEARLEAENCQFEGTPGVSAEAANLGLVPAFRDPRSGRVAIARFRDGTVAPLHVIEGLPEEWALDHDANGIISALRAEIECGFVSGGRFYTRAEAAEL